MQQVHLLVAVHGMWGNPSHLSEVARHAREKFAPEKVDAAKEDIQFEVLVAQTNSDSATYDGIDWGGERVADEVQEKIKEIEKNGLRKVTRFSVVGYSLGGLLSRYLIGVLHSRKLFESVRPVNFTTFATPHIGLLRYPSRMSAVMNYFGPKLLSRTGEQFYSMDSWTAGGKPLLLAMAEKSSVFYQALELFEHLSIYGSSVNDTTVPFVTSLIFDHDPFIDYEENGVTIDLDETYAPIVTNYHVPAVPPARPPKAKFGSREWWHPSKPSRPRLPPFLQFRFPGNLILYSMLPLLIPLWVSLALTKLSIDSSSSRKRIKKLEADESARERLVHVLRRLEHEMEERVVEMMDEPGVEEDSRPSSRAGPSRAVETSAETSTSPSLADIQADTDGDIPLSMQPPIPEDTKSKQPIFKSAQLEMVQSLNSLPKMRKYMAFFPHVLNSHALIICRDVKRFESHRRGEGVLRHWVDHFEL